MSFVFTVVVFILMMAALSLFFLPTIIAISRKHDNALPIFLTNLYLGVTFFGWAVALIWAFSANNNTTYAVQGQTIPLGAQPVARPYKKGPGALHYALVIGATLLAAMIVLFILAPSKLNVQTTETTTTIKTGVPMSADELFGTAPAADKK